MDKKKRNLMEAAQRFNNAKNQLVLAILALEIVDPITFNRTIAETKDVVDDLKKAESLIDQHLTL